MTNRAVVSGIVIIFAVTLCQAMPLHPRLAEMIKNGQISGELLNNNAQLFKSKGIDQGKPQRPTFLNNPSGQLKALAILVDFSNHPGQTVPVTFDSLIFGISGNTVRNYYSEVSYGRLDIITLNMPSSTGWLMMPETCAYYANGQFGAGDYPHNSQKLAEDAVYAANPYIDFSQYDNDSDGIVDMLFIVHSGMGYEFSRNANDIRSVKWTCNQYPNIDGVSVREFTIEPEYMNFVGDMTCGVFAHELGHIFGLSDLYDEDLDPQGHYDSQGLGNWSLMGIGSWNGNNGSSPAHPDAWSRLYLGFADTIKIPANTIQTAIPAIEDTGIIYRLWADGQDTNEYFLVENRQRIGFDSYLPAAGLLIYHIDDNISTNNNQWYPGHTSSGHYKVALEQADGNWDMEHNNNGGDGGDPYPGTINNQTFNNSSTPNSGSYEGDTTYVGVTGISISGPLMYANLAINNAAAAPNPISPVDGACTNNRLPTFDFSDSPGATLYRFQIDDTNSFSSPLYDLNNLTVSQFIPPAQLLENVYYWRAQAYNNLAWSSWSPIWKVTIDTTAPASPIDLTANGANPSHWTDSSDFSIGWSSPADLSGIKQAFYKLGSAPNSLYDTTGSLAAPPPVTMPMNIEGGYPAFFWLMDNAGNVNYENFTMVILNYDSTRPTGCVAMSPESSDVVSFMVRWSHGTDSGGSGLSGKYTIYKKIGEGSDSIPWLVNVIFDSAEYTGMPGEDCYFDAFNIDNAGNIEQSHGWEAFTHIRGTMLYIPGDINCDSLVRGSDVTYAVRYFKGIGLPPCDSCYNPEIQTPSHWLYRAGDVNGDCLFKGSDVTFLVRYFKGLTPNLLYCPYTPPY